MTDFYYATEMAVRGPWLIDKDQLLKLDAVIDQQVETLTAYRSKKIEPEVQVELAERLKWDKKALTEAEAGAARKAAYERVASRYENQPPSKELTLLLNGKKKLVVKSVADALKHPGIAECRVEELIFFVRAADVKVSLACDCQYNQVALRVSPEHEQQSRETFAALRQWVVDCQPTSIHRSQPLIAFLAWIVFLIGFVFGSYTVQVFKGQPVSRYAEQAVQLIKQGITATNEQKAVETILALQAGYNPDSKPASIPRWWLASFFVGLLACVALSIQPNSHIGIARGEGSVRRWRAWLQFLLFSVPVFVFTAFVWPAFEEFFKGLFKGP